MHFLNREAIYRVDAALIQDAVATAYRMVLDQSYNMPDRMHVGDGENMLLLMPCFSKTYFATKLVSVFPKAPELGCPSVNGVMVLSDNQTGQPLAIMDGAAVTAERTGAVGGLGVSFLTPETLASAGILGAGVQGFSQARFLLKNRPVNEVFIYDIHPEAARSMADGLSQDFPRVKITVAPSAEALVEASELVIAATTSSRPLFRDDVGLVKGKTFVSIGSFRPDMKEFPDAVIATADTVFTDTPFAAKESGDICIPLEKGVVKKEKIQPFADLLRTPVKKTADQTLFFKSVGMALFDLTVASTVYAVCKDNNWGQKLDF